MSGNKKGFEILLYDSFAAGMFSTNFSVPTAVRHATTAGIMAIYCVPNLFTVDAFALFDAFIYDVFASGYNLSPIFEEGDDLNPNTSDRPCGQCN